MIAYVTQCRVSTGNGRRRELKINFWLHRIYIIIVIFLFIFYISVTFVCGHESTEKWYDAATGEGQLSTEHYLVR
jgi:hypothetical protein